MAKLPQAHSGISSDAEEHLQNSAHIEGDVLPESRNEVSAFTHDHEDSLCGCQNLADMDARKEYHWNLTVCGILHYIDNGLAGSEAKPADVAKGVVQYFLTYHLDRHSHRFREGRPTDFRKIKNIMDKLVRSPKYCIRGKAEQRELVQFGSKICTDSILHQVGYGTQLPPMRPDIPEAKDVVDDPTSSNRGFGPNGAHEIPPASPKDRTHWYYEPVETDLEHSLQSIIPTSITRKRYKPEKLGFPPSKPPQRSPSQNQSLKSPKRKTPRIESTANKRSCLSDNRTEDRGCQTIPDTSRHLDLEVRDTLARTPKTPFSYGDCSDFYFDEDGLKSQMYHLYDAAASLVDTQILPDQGINLDQPAVFALGKDCNAQLSLLYEALLGKGIVGDARRQVSSIMLVSELSIALIGAFIFSIVFAYPELETVDTWSKKMHAAIDQKLTLTQKELRHLGTDLDTLLRRIHLSHIHQPYFQDSILAPIAQNLADELCFQLYDHLSAHEKRGTASTLSHNDAVLRWSESFAKLIKRALTMKCEMSTAREDYSVQWFSAGTRYDPRLMESGNAPGEVVLAPVFPGIAVKKDGSTKPVCRAQVRLS